MSKKLVIVESPAKARTIEGFLGPDYVVESSIGHIRDIPASAKDAPESLRDEWRRTRFGVDVENDFKPLYVVNPDKKKQVAKLKKHLRDAAEVYLATDEDREGEAIAWHLSEVLNPRVPVQRMVFHEITPEAIRRAIDSPRELDRRLVDAQEARRILDRLYGYEVSPVLWKKIKRGLSAGRVQSPAIRIVVDRERKRMAFVSGSYWDLVATFTVSPNNEGSASPEDDESFEATLIAVDDRKVAGGRDFGPDGRVVATDVVVLDEPSAARLADELRSADFSVASVEAKPYTRRPYPPFRTATLQQEAGRKLKFGARRTMSAAQRLYESGYITYMRTDSVNLSETAVAAARALVTERYGDEYLPAGVRVYKGKVKSAQEAHEAIRPAGEQFTEPSQVADAFGQKSDEARLYDMIWQRTVASQMKDAKGESVQVRIQSSATPTTALFSASGKTITFPGFLRAYVEGSDDPDAALDDQERHLPSMAEGNDLDTVDISPKGHETKPPARYTEASLVKRLEELGIGRPSTYASIISTIQERGYVYKKGAALVPTFTAFATVALMEQHFGDLVDYAFTARMEDDLDEIANGQEEAVPWLARFYFGNGHPGLRKMVSDHLDEIDPREINSIPIGVDEQGQPVVARVGQYGPYVRRGEDTASIPEDLPPDELTIEIAVSLLEAPNHDRILGDDPESGLEVIARNGRFGPYVQLGAPDPDEGEKPKTASLLSSMSLESVTLDEALRLLSLPRVVGEHPEDGAPIEAQNGRYGPYLRWGKETRSLDAEEQIFTIDLEGALGVLAQPKRRRGAAPPLRELGDDPNSGQPVVLRNGRYGPYVTDGEHNASLRTGDTIDGITLERAAELLQERREKAPKQKSSGRTKSSKKAPSSSKKAPSSSKKAPSSSKKAASKPGKDGANE